MKNLSLLLNLILLIAVAYLYFHTFSNTKTELVKEDVKNSNRSTRLAFINVDSLDSQFKMVSDMREEIAQEKVSLQNQLKSKATKLEKDYMSLQEDARYLTQTQALEKQNELVQRQEKLIQLEQTLNEKLIKLEADRNEMLQKSVSAAIKEVNNSNDYDFVFGFNGWGNLLYAGDSLDITSSVLEQLNNTYTKSKNKE